jgi:hypothetical protein
MNPPPSSTIEASWRLPHDIAPWVRALAVVLGGSLDQRLALGQAPESSQLLAARAEYLVAIRRRRALCEDWTRLLEQARRTTPSRRAVRLCRERILAAEPLVGEMLRALLTPLPVPAQGVAMVGCLLSDGTGPLYNWNCPMDLSHAVRQAILQLDPAVPLAESLLSSR